MHGDSSPSFIPISQCRKTIPIPTENAFQTTPASASNSVSPSLRTGWQPIHCVMYPSLRAANPTRILGRRKRETTIEDLPDDILTKIIQYALQMNPRRLGEISRRVRPRFEKVGKAIAMVSRRFNTLLRNSITSIEVVSTAPHTWFNAMVVFSKNSLQTLHLSVRGREDSSLLCLILASTEPPLRTLAVSSLHGAPFEHLVAMLRALPNLRECDIQYPRPVDLAALAHSCPRLTDLSLGAVRHLKDVDEIRRQFVNMVASPLGPRLVSLNMPWCCATVEAFEQIRRRCSLERFAAEFGVMHWLNYRAFKSEGPLAVDPRGCVKEQRLLLRKMLRAVSKAGTLQSFAFRTWDGIPSSDLELLFSSLKGLEELDLFVGSAKHPMLCGDRSFNRLTKSLSSTLHRVNIVGMSFTPEQVSSFSASYPKLNSVSVWMGKTERPSVQVFESFGKRIKHLSLLCDWNEGMCEAVGRHNTSLESLFLVTKELPMSSIQSLLTGTRFTLNEFRLFFNRKTSPDEGQAWSPGELETDTADDRSITNSIVQNAARLVAKDCAANLEVLNISAASKSGRLFDCTGIAKELGRSAPHLWQICDAYLKE